MSCPDTPGENSSGRLRAHGAPEERALGLPPAFGCTMEVTAAALRPSRSHQWHWQLQEGPDCASRDGSGHLQPGGSCPASSSLSFQKRIPTLTPTKGLPGPGSPSHAGLPSCTSHWLAGRPERGLGTGSDEEGCHFSRGAGLLAAPR